MKIDLRNLEEGINALTWDETPGDLSLADVSQDFIPPIRTKMNVVKFGESLTASGSSSFRLRQQCARCLESFEQSFSVDFQFIFHKGDSETPDESGDEAIVLIREEAGHLDLANEVRGCILVEIPMNPACDEDCKGLCSSCGVNLNTETCGCTHETTDSRWDALREMKNTQ